MRRVEVTPRENPYLQMEAQGFTWHHNYWREGACYEFSNREVDEIEAATNGLWGMCMDLVYDVIGDEALLTKIGVPQDPNVRDILRSSWENDHETLIGRFDFAWDGQTVRMFEFNADTPTSLLEAAVIQWAWFEEVYGKKDGFDQYNTLHEKLVEAWKKVAPYSRVWGSKPIIHFAHMDDAEDGGTVGYLRDTASQAGYDNTPPLWVEELGFEKDTTLRGADGEVISHLFKLYPWENFFEDIKGNASYLQAMKKVRCIEPAWKMILSSKGILPLLWERHPGHPNLLESYFLGEGVGHKLKNYVTKPLFSREGANVQIHAPSLGHILEETPGGYSDHPKVVQEFFPVLPYNGFYPTLGSWLINGEACGMGIRESVDLVAGNRSCFVPHIIFG